MKDIRRRLCAAAVTAAVFASALAAPNAVPPGTTAPAPSFTADAAGELTIDSMPAEYRTAADWIWNNRIMNEDSCGVKSKRWNLLFDQIIRNKGQLNYVVRWQSTQQITYEQRKSFETFVEEGVNKWTDLLVGFEDWPYDHVKVNIIGWACIDRNSLLDLHDDEVVWTDTEFDELSNSQAGVPSKLPVAPSSMWTFEHFNDKNYVYPEVTFDEYLWCTQNYGDYGGCGGDWGQRLSDNYYLAAASGSGMPHIYWHELGHGFGQTDFYGGEGASDGFPPGGFPGGENSIMMAGSASKITDFDSWMFRYIWDKIKDDSQRFDLANALPDEPVVTTTTTAPVTSAATTTTTAAPEVRTAKFTAEITDVGNDIISFKDQGTFNFFGTDYYGGNEQFNLKNYEAGDVVAVEFEYSTGYSGTYDQIDKIISLELEKNVRDTTASQITYGDVNLDGSVTLNDAVAILQYVANQNKYPLSAQALANADCCDPGTSGVTGIDALSIQKLDAKAIQSLPEYLGK